MTCAPTTHKLLSIFAGLSLGLVPRCSCHENPVGPNAHSDGGSGNPGPRTLHVTPATVTLATDGVTPAMQTFKVTATFSDGTVQDVTQGTVFSLENNALGTMNGPLFVSNLSGGSSKLTALNGA